MERFCLVVLALTACLAPAPAAATASSGKARIVEIPLTFGVENTNDSRLACLSVPGHHDLRGWLVAPKSALTSQSHAVTLYLHGLNGNLWRVKAPRGYDYAAEMARLGHASVIIDRLGYGSSPQPYGFATCLGAQAAMAHQVVTHLRNGTYSADGIAPISFNRVALAAHSAGGGIAELAAYSYKDVDVLITIAHADQGFSARASDEELPKTARRCAQGGERKYEPDGPSGYAFFPTTDAGYRELFFSNAARDAIAAAVELRERDPCGDLDSFLPMTIANRVHLHEIGVPVLLVFGEDDAVFAEGAPEAQKELYKRPDEESVTLIKLPQTGHVSMLEKTAPELRSTVSDWLLAHGF